MRNEDEDESANSSEDDSERERRAAKIIRSAKAANKWTENELHGYNITIKEESEDKFFDLGGNPLPPSTVDSLPVILNNLNMSEAHGQTIPKSIRLFFKYLEHVTKDAFPDRPTESAVDDFGSHLLGSVLGYDLPDRLIRQRMEIDLSMCGMFVKAKPKLNPQAG